MRVKDKLMMDRNGLEANGPINIVIFGDSVSHGALNGTFDYETVYWNRLRQMLNAKRSYVPVNMICASVGGAAAESSLPRLERDVLAHHPDLVIVSFGLNDVNLPLERFTGPLREIFTRCLKAGSDVIFLTPNMLNTYVADDTAPGLREYAAKTAQMQNEGRMDRYIEEAKAVARACGATVCDCYAEWKKLAKTQDTTMLLCNRINHPTSEMHALFADKLFDLLIDAPVGGTEESAMFGR